MPMGTVGHLANGTAGFLTKQQAHRRPSFTAYTNGVDYSAQRWTSSQFPDDRTSHGATEEASDSRPVSQGVGSATSGQSRPATSQGMSSVSPTTAAAVGSATHRRPESSGTDVAPPPTMRHGFAEAYSSEEYLTMLEQVFYMYFTFDRHESCATPTNTAADVIEDWRPRERLKTVSAALVLCLNIGIDPPDIVKTHPCAKLECWIDPESLQPSRALEKIGKNLQEQYETLSMRTRYKLQLDPSTEDAKKFCQTMRRSAKDERVLFHYNGHGVPKPTSGGEIWVFNKNLTQYIPVPVYDFMGYLGTPCLYVWDCSAAGRIVTAFQKFADQRDAEVASAENAPNPPRPKFKDCIHLAACRTDEVLPMNPDLPADLFTSCLTTPIDIALRIFILQNPMLSKITVDQVKKIPGRTSDRKSPRGELYWIFTSVTDTIAWSVLPRPLFKKLFRQDLLVAALFRNFLLADRIMRGYNCHPISNPPLPPTHNHPMWDAWDLAVDQCLNQMPEVLEKAERLEKEKAEKERHNTGEKTDKTENVELYHTGKRFSSFFEEQLTAFEVWLQTAAITKDPPDQLPIVLQVLLSQFHRLRALLLLTRFLDLGPWAVNLALSIGIFPYVCKLLLSPAADLKATLIFIWARILAVDKSCQNDLLKDNGYTYFVRLLSSPEEPTLDLHINENCIPEHRSMCSFILAVFCRDFRQGQIACMAPGVMQICLRVLKDTKNPAEPLMRHWTALLISQLWNDFPEAKWQGIREGAPVQMVDLLHDQIPEVRVAALVALTTLIGSPGDDDQTADVEKAVAVHALGLNGDGSSVVRKELVIFLSKVVARFEVKFIVTAMEYLREERFVDFDRKKGKGKKEVEDDEDDQFSRRTIFGAVWRTLLLLSEDPFPDVAVRARAVIDGVFNALTALPRDVLEELPLTTTQSVLEKAPLLQPPPVPSRMNGTATLTRSNTAQPTLPRTPTKPNLSEAGSSSSGLFHTLKRTASVAYNLAMGGEVATENVPPAPNVPPKETEVRPAPLIGLKRPTSRSYKEGSKEFKLPLKSDFFDWSTEYFQRPQMKDAEAEEPGSLEYNKRLWRRTRNELIINETQPLKEIAGASHWQNTLTMLDNESHQPLKLLFHQFEPHLVISDDRDGVFVWDWHQHIRLNSFRNGNKDGTKITSTVFLNEDDVALLMVGSSDGILKIYRNYESPQDIELLTAWRALSDLVPQSRAGGSGLVVEWQQGTGRCLVGGDMKVIRMYDAGNETLVADFNARSGSPITSLTSDQVAGHYFIAGFGDGAVRAYDARLDNRNALVHVWKQHKSWIVNVHMQRGGIRELVTGSSAGEVKLFDILQDQPIRTITAHTTEMRCLAVHEHAPVFATGSTTSSFKIWNMDGTHLSTSRHQSGFLNQGRTAGIAGLSFHPHAMVLAEAGNMDGHVRLLNAQ